MTSSNVAFLHRSMRQAASPSPAGAAERVEITVTDGVAYVDRVPPGVVVRVTDYDVDPQSPERDDQGRPCARWEVAAPGRAIERKRPTMWER